MLWWGDSWFGGPSPHLSKSLSFGKYSPYLPKVLDWRDDKNVLLAIFYYKFSYVAYKSWGMSHNIRYVIYKVVRTKENSITVPHAGHISFPNNFCS